jgi:hypothetical protein
MSLDEHNADPKMNALESALAGLRPRPSGVNRDRLMFDAGREAERSRTIRPRRLWLLSVGVAAGAAASFGVLLLDARTQLARLQVVLRERPVAAAVASASANEPKAQERRAVSSEIPLIAPQTTVGQADAGLAAREFTVSKWAVAMPTPIGGQGNYLALRNRALRLGVDALAGASTGFADHKAARAGDAPAANRDLRQDFLNRSVRQPSEFEVLRRSLPVFDGERL